MAESMQVYYRVMALKYMERAAENERLDAQGKREAMEEYGAENGRVRWIQSWLHKDLTGDRKDWTQTSIMYSLLALLERGD